MPWTRNSAWALAAPSVPLRDLPGRLLERPDELPADDLALALGVGDAGQGGGEVGAGVDHHKVDAGGGDEVLLDLFGLVLA